MREYLYEGCWPEIEQRAVAKLELTADGAVEEDTVAKIMRK
jgi:hypothetical protein